MPTNDVGMTSYARDFCAIAQPIYWDSADDVQATPPGILRSIVTHNELGASLCGWGMETKGNNSNAKN